MEKETKKQEEKKISEYELVEVPTGSALAIKTPDERILSQEQALIEILNIVEKIKRSTV